MGPPYRADHVGSLLRPPELLQARAAHEAGRIADEELRRIEDDAIHDAVRMQQEIGLQGVTDGEFRRGSWHMDFIYQIGGISKAPGMMPAPMISLIVLVASATVSKTPNRVR